MPTALREWMESILQKGSEKSRGVVSADEVMPILQLCKAGIVLKSRSYTVQEGETSSKESEMATRTAHLTHVTHRRISLPQPHIEIRRKDILVCRILMVIGLVIPALMVLAVIPASLGLPFLGFGLTAVGGVLALIRCGEIC